LRFKLITFDTKNRQGGQNQYGDALLEIPVQS